MRKILLLLIVSVFLIGVSSATICYQETANQSTVGDGNCDLYYSGSYAMGGISSTTFRWIDGDWNTGSDLTDSIVVHYKKPVSASRFSLISFKYDGIYLNYTIPEQCWNLNSSYFRFFIGTSYSIDPTLTGLSCPIDESNFLNRIQIVSKLNSDINITEEAMNWQIEQQSSQLKLKTGSSLSLKTGGILNLK